MNLSPPILIFLAFAVYGLVHSFLASNIAKDFSKLFFGKASDRFYRIFYNAFSFIAIIPILAMPVALPDKPMYTIPQPWNYLALVLQIIGLIGAAASVMHTGAFEFIGLSQALGIKSKSGLVTGGLYKYIRHPIYTFSILFIWATPAMSYNLAALYLSFTLYFIVGALFEERKLVKAYGEEYLEYKSRTPMLIPFL